MPPIPEWSLIQSLLLQLVLPAGAAAAVAFLALRFIPRLNRAAVPLGVAVGLVAGNFGRGLVPFDALEFGWPGLVYAALIPLVGIGLMMAAVLADAKPKARRTAFGFSLLLILAGVLLATPSDVPLPWLTAGTPDEAASPPPASPWPQLMALPVCGLLVLGIYGSLRETLSRAWPRAGLPITGAIWGGGCMTLLLYAHSARFADLAMLMAVPLVAVGLLNRLGKPVDDRAAVAGASVFFPGLMLAGWLNTFSEVPAVCFALVGLAPLILGMWLIPPLRRRLDGRGKWLAVATLVVPIAVAVGVAMRYEALDFG